MGQLEELRAFVLIAEQGSIGKAAMLDGVAKSGMSRRLRLLEERLGTELVSRNTRQWTLTPEGETYLAHATRFLADLDEADAELADRGAEIRGERRLTVPLHYGRIVLAEGLLSFCRAHPKVRLDIDFTDRQVDVVGEGFDLAVRIGALDDSSLLARKIAETRHVFCAHPGYLETAPVLRRPEDLTKHRILQFGHARRFNWTFGPAGKRVQLRSVFNASDGEALKLAASSGLGITRLPDFVAFDALEDGSLLRVLEAHEPPPIPISIVYPNIRHMPYRKRAIINWIVERCRPRRDPGP